MDHFHGPPPHIAVACCTKVLTDAVVSSDTRTVVVVADSIH